MNTQQLRAQIVALQDATLDENNNFRTAYDEGKFDALTAVTNLLDSMQEEPISEKLKEASIDKNIIVKELERRINALQQTLNPREQAVKYECQDLLSFINNL